MKFFDKKNASVNMWLPIIGGPILSLVVFLASWWFDPLGFKQLSGIPAFFFSVISLTIAQWFVTVREVQKTAQISEEIREAVKNYLHVTPVGSPAEAIRYITGRLPALREVMNTSFTLDDEYERCDEKLYETDVYGDFSLAIVNGCQKQLIWKDIGDSHALARLRRIQSLCQNADRNGQGKSTYKYRTLNHIEPQINFILLEYKEGGKEVLFNWDFRSLGQDPIVLVSRDNHIVEMFTVQFKLLWRKASEDHDSQATSSVSTQ